VSGAVEIALAGRAVVAQEDDLVPPVAGLRRGPLEAVDLAVGELLGQQRGRNAVAEPRPGGRRRQCAARLILIRPLACRRLRRAQACSPLSRSLVACHAILGSLSVRRPDQSGAKGHDAGKKIKGCDRQIRTDADGGDRTLRE
jgi:hypothetical protein